MPGCGSEDHYLLDVEPGHGQRALDRLKRFMLRVDLTIEVASVPVLALRSPGSAAAAATAVDGVITLAAGWGGSPGVDLVLIDDAAEPTVASAADGPTDHTDRPLTVWLSADIPTGPAELLEVVRIASGKPAVGTGLDESTIPAEARVVDLSVDFTKGCYVGQELVARVDSRGSNTPTMLYGLRFHGPAVPAIGTELSLDGALAGAVTSTAVSPSLGPIGLGYLRRAVDVPATLTAIGPDGRPITVSAVDLPQGG